MADRIGSTSNIEINWVVPQDILAATPAFYDKIIVLKSASENTGYNSITSIPSADSFGNFITSYVDITESNLAKDSRYYLVQFEKTSTPPSLSKFFPTFFGLTPRELRLTAALRTYLSPYIANRLTDDDLRQGYQLALQAFNITPPLTAFTIDTFPKEYEPLLQAGAQIYSLLFRYLGVAITDFGYGDQGLSLTIDRGAKVKQATDQLLAVYNGLVTTAKLEFSYEGAGMGTLQLPISLGGNLNRGILNVLDVFTSLGR